MTQVCSSAVIHVDCNDGNTDAVGGPADGWFVAYGSQTQPDWTFRAGYGFDETGNNGVFETDNQGAVGGTTIGDQKMLVTTISNLIPGQLYHVYVDYLSATNSNWAVMAGLAPDQMQGFSRVNEMIGVNNHIGTNDTLSRVENLGLTSVNNSNRIQLRGLIGQAFADDNGQIAVYIDDVDTASGSNYRVWYDGVAYEILDTPFCQNPPAYDLTDDCIVDVQDLSVFMGEWFEQGPVIVPPQPGEVYPVINDNSAWCWYEDERVIIDNGKLLIGSVADNNGTDGAVRNGNIEVAAFDFATGNVEKFVLNANLQADDHDSPALLVRPDGRYLAVYSKHGSDNYSRYRISTNPHDITAWQPEKIYNPGAGTTYSNVYQFNDSNRIYNFHRALDWNPTMSYSDDQGQSWQLGGKLLTRLGDRPYVRYASNDIDAIHFITTEGHPRNVNNSIYHGYVKDGKVYNSAGVVIDNNIYDNNAESPTAYTKIFAANTVVDGNPMTRAWTVDLEVDSNGNPYAIFQARIDPGALSAGTDSLDHMFFYARYDGSDWLVNKLAYAGRDIYAASPNGSEDDYTGLVSLDPDDSSIVYLSANVDPITGDALISSADNKQHYEIFKGFTADGGANWAWTSITENSSIDNIRPIKPASDGANSALLWLAGKYYTYTDFDLNVVGIMIPSNQCISPDMDFDGNCVVDLQDFAIFGQYWLECGLYPQSFCGGN
ncbi:MAG: BNR-4 repeat-containing protein [Phycisphaerae bacterium]|nr:BNR-4 repeat-containing protein [Phycisphaerae bacterium]